MYKIAKASKPPKAPDRADPAAIYSFSVSFFINADGDGDANSLNRNAILKASSSLLYQLLRNSVSAAKIHASKNPRRMRQAMRPP
jgi:hypothetical protein